MPITMSEKAANEVHRIMKDKNMDPAEVALRLGVKGGGCSGFSYLVEFDKEKKEHDQEMTSQDIRILCDMKSYLYLNNMEMDFQEDLMTRQFTFKNPNAKTSCGCGTSFGV